MTTYCNLTAIQWIRWCCLGWIGVGCFLWGPDVAAQSRRVQVAQPVILQEEITPLELDVEDGASEPPAVPQEEIQEATQLPKTPMEDPDFSARILDKIVESEIQSSREVDRLNDRVQELLEMQKKRAEAKQSMMEAASKPVEAPQTSEPVVEAMDMDTEQLPPPTAESLEVPPAVSTEPLIPDSATKLLVDPPDPVALADSLYRSREWAIALDTYQSAQATNPSQTELIWIRYQMATCHRKLGQFEDAQQIYLEIANTAASAELMEPDKNEFVIAAKWWLDHLEMMTQLAAKTKIQIMNDIIVRSNQE